MLENPDMMPNATINRWIDNIKLFHFTLRHKNGATFGPDGLSRHLPQPEDEVYPNPFEADEDPGGLPDVVIADPTKPGPIPIKEFRDNIDLRGGHFHELVTDIHDFEINMLNNQGKMKRDREMMMNFLESDFNKMDKETTESYAQLVNQALVPALDSDKTIPMLIEWLKDPKHDPKHCKTQTEIKKFKIQ